MAVLYIAGNRPGAGKTSVAAALAARLTGAGRRPALVRALRADGASAPDPDAALFQRVVPGAPHAEAHPIAVTRDALSADPSLLDRVRERVAAASAGREPTVVEGLDGLADDDAGALASSAIADALDARVVLVLDYGRDLGEAEATAAVRRYGDRLAGVVINRVPCHATHDVAARLSTALKSHGVTVLGIVPEDRRMAAPSVAQVAEHLGAGFRVLDDLDEPEARLQSLVEHFMVGGSPLDNGAYVFSRRENKAVLVRGDRPDLQMAALETSTACLVLTGGREPVQYVTYHAEQQQVPAMLVEGSTLEVMEALGTVGERASVHNPLKVERFADLLDRHADMPALLAAAGGP